MRLLPHPVRLLRNWRLFHRVPALLILVAPTLAAQVNTGELRMVANNPVGVPLRAAITVISAAAHYSKQFTTDENGALDIRLLPFGSYEVNAAAGGLEANTALEIKSELPMFVSLRLTLKPVLTTIEVSEASTLIDPATSTSVMRLGERQITERVGSLPGRSVQDLVNSQPGWLYEGNAVLHPRGSEYQTQFVIDGVPLTDNRSPGFGPELEADDLDSVSIYTAGFPAEYGRKMGGVVELNTRRDQLPGTHGEVILGGGSFDTRQGYARAQFALGKNTFGVTASGSGTSHYLNPVVPQNFTNQGTTADGSVRFERDLTTRDTLILAVRHELSRFQIPNELLQQQAGQLQHGGNRETLGTIHYQHIFSTIALATVSGMVRDTSNTLDSNAQSTPIIATERNDFREGYFKAAFSLHRGRHELKAGMESDTTFLHENFSYHITDANQFDPGTPGQLAFSAHRPDLEQAAFLEDQVALGPWTLAAGLRYDHYQLLLNRTAVSPRVSISRYFRGADVVFHASYDRIFETPSFENILISSTPAIEALSANFLRLPVAPSGGNYFEGGLTEGLAGHLILTANIYRRNANNFADDEQLLNTGVSYPIAFDHAEIYGAEGKLELAAAGPFSGFASYSYMVGNVWFPVTGGLFLGGEAASAPARLGGHFPASQDQRNTLRTRFRYQARKRLWVAGGLSSGSGLPFTFEGTQADATAQYGPVVTGRINFDRARVKPSFAVNASAGLDLYRSEGRSLTFQADMDNLNNRLNVIDFGGLFSGNAIGPARSYALRMAGRF